MKITEKAYAKLRTQTQRDELLRLGTGFPFLRSHGKIERDQRGRFAGALRHQGTRRPK